MSWLKSTLVDIIALLLIAVFVFTQISALEIVIWVYTGILLLSKVLYFFIGYLQRKAGKSDAPDWFYHLVYISSIALLVFGQNYYLMSAWIVVWLLSILSTLKSNK